MLPPRFLAQAAFPFLLALVANVNAESHVINFVNKCGYGTPTLMYNGKNVLTGDSYTSSGPFSGIAYLQTGYCNTNGENCTLLETTLINPTVPGGGSSTDISLIPPHSFSVETSFAYDDGNCAGQGKTCSSQTCANSAFFTPTDYVAQVACQVNDVNLLVAFCAEASQLVTKNSNTVANATSSLPASTIPTSVSITSGTPTLEPSSSAPAPTSTQSNTDDPECEEPTTTAPTSTPTSTPTETSEPYDPGCEESGTTAPTSTPTQTSDPGCEDPDPITASATPAPSVSASHSHHSHSHSHTHSAGQTTPTSKATGNPTDPGNTSAADPVVHTMLAGSPSASAGQTTPTYSPTPSSTDAPSDPDCEESGPATGSHMPTVTPAPAPTSAGTGTGGTSDPTGTDPGCEEEPTTTPSTPTNPAPASVSAAPTGTPSADPSDPGCEESEPTTTASGTASAPASSTTEDPECEEPSSVPSGTPTPTLTGTGSGSIPVSTPTSSASASSGSSASMTGTTPSATSSASTTPSATPSSESGGAIRRHRRASRVHYRQLV